METLPPYQESLPSQESTVPSASIQTGADGTTTSPTNDPVTTPVVEAHSIIGGSGVRLPLSSDERIRFDRGVCARLRGFGTFTRTYSSASAASPIRTETFHVDDLYQSAASQLDVLLPALSTNTLPATTALRTITLRIDVPLYDSSWGAEYMRTGPVQGRAVLSKAFKSWITYFAQKKGEQALYEAADAITGRLAMEGFLVLEEWWDIRRKLLMLTVRC